MEEHFSIYSLFKPILYFFQSFLSLPPRELKSSPELLIYKVRISVNISN